MRRALVLLLLLVPLAAAGAEPVVTTDGARYYGPLRDGKFHGRGRIELPDGGEYRGEFADGKYDGRGRYVAPNGEIFEGDFDKGQFTGHGTWQRRDGARYRGAFRNGRFHGEGRFVDPQGSIYEGTFVEGELTGQGRAMTRDGDVYEGEFRNGLFDGKGTLRFAKPRPDGRKEISGIFRAGRLVDDPALRAAGEFVETALEKQQRLLEQALAGLAPGRRGVIDLYLLAVAGDGTQEVFRREADFVRRQFEERFGARERSVALVNSRNTVGLLPMATVGNVAAALRAIAARMDRDEDILFLFLTSHGTPEHSFKLQQLHMTLRDLPAAELARLVRESGIRWKVIVVSACYSGGFIEHLKDAGTLIITASRHDRASFGCADENEFTWFGRAFFKEALPASRSFGDAFARADALVAEWEKKERPKDERSLPQLHSTPAIQQHLARWWAEQR